METTATIIKAMSHDSHTLAVMLAKAKKGDVVTYLDMSIAISRNVQKEGRGALARARIIVERENGLVFRPVPNVGMKCLEDIETAKTASSSLMKIRRAAKRSSKSLSTIKSTEGWKTDDVIDLTVKRATLNFIYNSSSNKSLMETKEKVTLANGDATRYQIPKYVDTEK